MKFTITIYTDEDGVYIAECPSIPGCVSQGKTEDEAEKNVLEAIKDCLEAVLKTRTAFEKLSNQPPDASQNAPYHRYIHPICLIFYFCFRAYNNFKTAS